MIGQVGRRPVVELDHLTEVDDLAVDLLVLAQLLIGEVQVVELDALETGDFAGRSLLVDHHRVDQAVEIDVLDVERLLHGIAAGAEHGQNLGLVGGRIELCFDGVRPGHDQAEGKGRGEHLNEERFHVFDETLGRPPLITIIQEGELTVEILHGSGEILCGSEPMKFVLHRQCVNDGRHNPGGNNGWQWTERAPADADLDRGA